MSLLFAFFADIKCMTSVLSAYNIAPENSSIMSQLYIVIVTAIVLVAIKTNFLKIKNIGTPLLCLLIYCISLYIFTDSFVGEGTVNINYFIVFTIAALVIPSIIKIDGKIFVTAMMAYPVLGIFKMAEIFKLDYNEQAISMGQSYAFIIPVIASIVYLFLYYRSEKIVAIKWGLVVIAGINFVYFTQLVMFGSRGPLVCAIGVLIFLFCVRPQYPKGVSVNKKSLLVGFLIIMLGMLMLDKILSILTSLSDKVYAIEKIINLSQSGDVSNGRDYVYHMAWEGFLSSPIWGNGFAQFFRNTSEPYPHNSLLQILYDGGILFALLIFMPLIGKFKRYVRVASLNEYALLVLFFFAGFIASMFSDDLWMQPMLWSFFGMMLTKNKIIYNE